MNRRFDIAARRTDPLPDRIDEIDARLTARIDALLHQMVVHAIIATIAGMSVGFAALAALILTQA